MYENIRVPPWGCHIIRLGTKTLINWLIYWLSSVVGWGLGRCRKVLLSLFVKNNLLTILCTRAGAGVGGVAGQKAFSLLCFFCCCFIFVSYQLETKF